MRVEPAGAGGGTVKRRVTHALIAALLGIATAAVVGVYGALISPLPSAGGMIVYTARGDKEVWTGYRFAGIFQDSFHAQEHSGVRSAGPLEARWKKATDGLDPQNKDPGLFPGDAILKAERELSSAEIATGGVGVIAQGWPLRMLWYAEYWSGRPVMDTFVRRTAALNQRFTYDLATAPKAGSRLLGLRPLWAGVGGNVLAFSVAWWVLLAAPNLSGRVRRALRRRRGRCEACGYDLNGSPGRCPECGRSAAPQSAA